MLKWELETKELPLKVDWAISRGKCSSKTNFFIVLSDKTIKAYGEVAFNGRYEESEEGIREQFAAFLEDLPSTITSSEELYTYLEGLDLSASLRFGIESAFFHYLALASGKTVQELLGVSKVQRLKTSFSIPLMPHSDISDFFKSHDLTRFEAIKVKLDGKDDELRIKEIRKNFSGKLRFDANECFKNVKEVTNFLDSLGDLSDVELIEQPLPAHQHNEMKELKGKISIPIFADESLTQGNITDDFKECFDGVNIKLMKAGGYMNALKQIRQAREKGLKIMLGCMIETTLGISSAFHIAHKVDYFDLDGFLFLKDDPFKLIHEEKGFLFPADYH
jgi:L-alanine-DL-glutamate epimerase-like enolase superfamily enzyme